jgi:putative DNA methylase
VRNSPKLNTVADGNSVSCINKRDAMAIIDKINWPILDSLVGIQQRNRETHSPVISLFRWWARRPHAVVGAILDGASAEFGKKSFVVADPFSGGGTVAFEAARRGHAVYAQDLYPWPSLALAAALTRTDAKKFARASDELLRKLEPFREFYSRRKGGKTIELTHVIRVRVAPCPNCSVPIHLFRDAFVSMASRRAKERRAFFGCSACGDVSLRTANVKRFKCDICGHFSTVRVSRKRRSTVCCPHCETGAELPALLNRMPIWKPVLVQDRQAPAGTGPNLRPVRNDDPVEDIAPRPEEAVLHVHIPLGVETRHLLQNGFRLWSDIYTHRQIQTLLAAIKEVETADYPFSVRARLRFAVLGACEMAGYLCRWGRTHPKTFEAIANHRYSRSTVVTETNLLSAMGRGTLPRRLAAAMKGLLWLQEKSMPTRTTLATTAGKKRRFTRGALVATGNSGRQLLQDGSAQLVLTDPPYHDDVQYGELARLFHAWLAVVVPLPDVSEQMEAVPNPIRGTNTVRYAQIIKECLSESRRTLAAGGRLLLTFHNNKLEAWTALRNALSDSNFAIVGLATVSAENSADHSKRNKRTFLCDLVIECVPSPQRGKGNPIFVTVRGRNETKQRRNLLAVGLALAETANGQLTTDLKEFYEAHLSRLGESEKLIQ